MTDREKLIALMKEVKYPSFPGRNPDYLFGTQHPDHVFVIVAEHLLANGVSVPQDNSWIGGRYHERYIGSYEEQCSVCGEWSLEYDKPYCPNCGKKLK